MGKGFLWSGVSSSFTPLVFLPLTIAGTTTWAPATNNTPDSDYEVVGPDVFRFEYYYILAGSVAADGITTYPSIVSDTPWDTRIGHSAEEGMRDVTAIVVTIAVIDPKSRPIVSDTQLGALQAALDDFGAVPGISLESNWNNKARASSLPQTAASSIRIYTRALRFPSSAK